MKTKKYTSNGKTFYEVTFVSGENDNIFDEKPTTHTATVYFNGVWYFCICIDGKLANGLTYRTIKATVKNAWIVKDNYDDENEKIQKFFLGDCTATVIDCTDDAVNFRIVEIRDFNGNKVHEIRTTTKGKYAATLAANDARRFRLI